MPELVVRPQKIKVFGRPGGVVALSVILASSLSAPSIAMAAETTAPETNQIEVSAEANTPAAEQPAAPAQSEQPAASASNEQPEASAPSEQPAVAAPSEQPATPVSDLASNQQAGGSFYRKCRRKRSGIKCEIKC